jgi:predicted RNA-binding protein with PIN domain
MVDGNGLLEHWPSLAPGKPCTSEVAKQELIAQLTQYHDSTGVPVTLIFVGHNTGPFHSTPEVEIVFTPTPKAAESLLLRFISRIKIYGEVIVVTDNLAEHTRLESAGATIFSCAGFIQRMESALSELEQDITRYNQKERIKFTSGRIS